MVVVTAIIAVITGLILVSDSRFGGKVLLENLAYDMALSIRQAQVYGVSVQRFGTTFNVAYGMHFDTSNPTQYNTFADACSPANGLYDAAGGGCASGELVGQVVTLERGFRISKLCAPAGTNSATCTSVNPLDITFKRPEPDACFSASGTSDYTAGNCRDTYANARIVVKSPRGDLQSIIVEANGQITVQKEATDQGH